MMEALKQIAADKNLKMDVVFDTLKKGFLTAAMNYYGASDNIIVKIDHNTAEIKVYATKLVVQDIEDAKLEITLTDAKEIDPDTQMNEEIEVPLDVSKFGRNAIMKIKQILIQQTSEAVRDNIYDSYKDRENEVVSCVVQQIVRGDVIVLIGKVEAVLPRREQVKSERYFRGDSIRAMVVEVLKSSRGPQIILTRSRPEFVGKLFEIEVPEIYEGIVEIKNVSREAGERTKIAVYSSDDKVDALGACVGMKGIRIQSVVRELNNEKIDIIPWHEDLMELAARAMSPAKVDDVIINERDGESFYVIVEQDQLSVAIGKSGQNVKLASRLVGRDIDLMSREEYDSELLKMERADMPLVQYEGLTDEIKKNLVAAGMATLGNIAEKTLIELSHILKIDKEDARMVVDRVERFITNTEVEQEASADSTDEGATEALQDAVTTDAPATGERPGEES